jgi:hypothetical protein
VYYYYYGFELEESNREVKNIGTGNAERQER